MTTRLPVLPGQFALTGEVRGGAVHIPALPSVKPNKEHQDRVLYAEKLLWTNYSDFLEHLPHVVCY